MKKMFCVFVGLLQFLSMTGEGLAMAPYCEPRFNELTANLNTFREKGSQPKLTFKVDSFFNDCKYDSNLGSIEFITDVVNLYKCANKSYCGNGCADFTRESLDGSDEIWTEFSKAVLDKSTDMVSRRKKLQKYVDTVKDNLKNFGDKYNPSDCVQGCNLIEESKIGKVPPKSFCKSTNDEQTLVSNALAVARCLQNNDLTCATNKFKGVNESSLRPYVGGAYDALVRFENEKRVAEQIANTVAAYKKVLDSCLGGFVEDAKTIFDSIGVVDDNCVKYLKTLAHACIDGMLEDVLSQVVGNIPADCDSGYYDKLDSALNTSLGAEAGAIMETKILSGETVRNAAKSVDKIYNSDFIYFAHDKGLTNGVTMDALGQACFDFVAYSSGAITDDDCRQFLNKIIDEL